MCDFHSVLDEKFEIRHDATNSHSGMAGELRNMPNRKPVIFEAGWNGSGELPPDTKLLSVYGSAKLDAPKLKKLQPA